MRECWSTNDTFLSRFKALNWNKRIHSLVTPLGASSENNSNNDVDEAFYDLFSDVLSITKRKNNDDNTNAQLENSDSNHESSRLLYTSISRNFTMHTEIR